MSCARRSPDKAPQDPGSIPGTSTRHIDDNGPGPLTGAVSWNVLDDGTVDIHRLVVAPRAFRRGIATALLHALDARFPCRHTLVSTGRDNGPARELYRRRGFTVVRQREPIPGLWVTDLERPGRPVGRD